MEQWWNICKKDMGSIPGSEDLLEEEMETHSTILAWRIPWTEEPVRLQSMGWKESDKKKDKKKKKESVSTTKWLSIHTQ